MLLDSTVDSIPFLKELENQADEGNGQLLSNLYPSIAPHLKQSIDAVCSAFNYIFCIYL